MCTTRFDFGATPVDVGARHAETTAIATVSNERADGRLENLDRIMESGIRELCEPENVANVSSRRFIRVAGVPWNAPVYEPHRMMSP